MMLGICHRHECYSLHLKYTVDTVLDWVKWRSCNLKILFREKELATIVDDVNQTHVAVGSRDVIATIERFKSTLCIPIEVTVRHSSCAFGIARAVNRVAWLKEGPSLTVTGKECCIVALGTFLWCYQ